MTGPEYAADPDKVTITCYYGDDQKCKQITVYLNHDDLTAADVAAAIRAAFNAADHLDPALASTKIIPRFNGSGTRDFDTPSSNWWGQ